MLSSSSSLVYSLYGSRRTLIYEVYRIKINANCQKYTNMVIQENGSKNGCLTEIAWDLISHVHKKVMITACIS